MDKSGRSLAASRVILFLLSGPIVWAVHLLFVYGPQSSLCADPAGVDAPPSVILGLVTAVTVASAAAIVLLAVAARPLARLAGASGDEADTHPDFLVAAMRLLALLSLAGVVWAGLPAFLLDPCATLR